MKGFFSALLIGVAMIGFAPNPAWAASKGDEIKAFVAAADLDTMLYGMEREAGEYAKSSATRTKALADLDAAVPHAVAYAAGHTDLIKAIKEFYVADRAYLENAYTDSDQPESMVKAHAEQLKETVDQKSSAIDLEINLAGAAFQ